MNPRRSPLPTDVGSLPPLPAEFDGRLSAGLDALAIDLPPDARSKLVDHVRLLLAWNESINLTAIRDPVAAATAHVVDSLSAVPLLRREGVRAFLDLGSGGGFPGIPLAVALPADRAVLVESIGKKARFLE
ncbi:MAG TPA: RsmG family class I SAM-dependent methyltransferase, partial [Candidatus Acidoferrum sp.]|nr:RsmG family class I SAM-dependent methyltransferase [Candidatus Acidoferrum sp.]